MVIPSLHGYVGNWIFTNKNTITFIVYKASVCHWPFSVIKNTVLLHNLKWFWMRCSVMAALRYCKRHPDYKWPNRVQTMWCKMYRIRESLSYLYNISICQCYGEFIILICVETNWPGSWFEMVVLDCRSFMLVIMSIVLLRLFSECICTYSSYL